MGTYRTDPSDLSESQIEQLREIQRNRRKQSLRGIGREVEGFIGRLLENSARLKFWNLEGHLLGQLRLLYMMGWGETVKAATFEEYLSGIPEIPEQFLAADERFPHLVLVDKRPGLKRCCLLARLRSGVDTDFEIVPFDQEKPIKDSVYWIRANDGRQNQNRNLLDCREFFVKTGDEIGLEIDEAVALYGQIEAVRKVVVEGSHNLDLPGSVAVGGNKKSLGINLGNWGSGPVFNEIWNGKANPKCGSASRRLLKAA